MMPERVERRHRAFSRCSWANRRTPTARTVPTWRSDSTWRAIGLIFLVFAMVLLPWRASHAEYKLGPQDKVRVRVYDWRVASAQVHEWAALGGEFVISAGGVLSLPLVGDVPATDRSPSELAAEISERLRTRLGLAHRPDSAVDVVQYRPFYILGYVDKPGEYAYRPGMTVLEAVGLAGGLLRTTDFRRLEREAITNRGELQALQAEQIADLAQQARLEAELGGADVITFPSQLIDQKSTPGIATMMREEELLFKARRETLRSQLESFKQIKSLMQSEISSLGAKAAGLQRQLGLARQELDGINKLVDRGLVVTARRLAVEQTAAQFESSLIDLDLTKLRAQQDISKADRDATDLVNRRNNDVLVDLGKVRTKLATMTEKRAMLERLIHDSELVVPEQGNQFEKSRRLSFKIVKRLQGETRTTTVEEGQVIEPGDLLQVALEPLGSSRPTSPSPEATKPPLDKLGALPSPGQPAQEN